jgi:ABC-type lipoprotein release transport system permease subunit
MKRIMEISFLVLAFRNLGRHKAKTVLTTISVSLTVFLFVALESYNLGTILDIKRYMLLYESGAAMISAKTDHENKKEEPLREGIQDYRNLVSELERAGFRAAPRARVSGMLSGKEDPLPLTLIAIDPDREKAVFRNHAYVVKGEFVREGRSDIVIGRTLALDLGVDVGDTVFFTAPLTKEDSRGGIVRFTQRIALRVGGILNTPNVTVNTGLGYVALEAMQGEEGLILDGRVTEICLRDAKATERDLVLETESPANVRRRLSGILPDTLMVTGWDEGAKEFLALADGLRLATFVTLPVFLVLGLLGIGNTMAIAIKQRGREIGMLRALGMHNSEITRSLVYESGLIGFIGTVIGIALGLALTGYLVYRGIDITPALEAGLESIDSRKAYIIHSAWSPRSYAFVSVLVPAFCAFFSLFPSRKALRADIAETLRTEFL